VTLNAANANKVCYAMGAGVSAPTDCSSACTLSKAPGQSVSVTTAGHSLAAIACDAIGGKSASIFNTFNAGSLAPLSVPHLELEHSAARAHAHACTTTIQY
jgi:hypothetical protein